MKRKYAAMVLGMVVSLGCLSVAYAENAETEGRETAVEAVDETSVEGESDEMDEEDGTEEDLEINEVYGQVKEVGEDSITIALGDLVYEMEFMDGAEDGMDDQMPQDELIEEIEETMNEEMLDEAALAEDGNAAEDETAALEENVAEEEMSVSEELDALDEDTASPEEMKDGEVMSDIIENIELTDDEQVFTITENTVFEREVEEEAVSEADETAEAVSEAESEETLEVAAEDVSEAELEEALEESAEDASGTELEEEAEVSEDEVSEDAEILVSDGVESDMEMLPELIFEEISLDDIKVGDIVQIIVDDEGNAESIVVLNFDQENIIEADE